MLKILISEIVKRAIVEDMPWSDITTNSLFSDSVNGKGMIFAKENMIVSGVLTAIETFNQVDSGLGITLHINDGQPAENGDLVMEVFGDLKSILKGERIALNFLQRLSGIATLTAQMVERCNGAARVCDTRKTTPTLRILEKKAVSDGGGYNHRYSLSDAVLIKDTHLSAFNSVGDAVKKAKEVVGHTVKVEVEIDDLNNIEEAIVAGADIIMLDNMTPDEVDKGVKIIQNRCDVEVSGNISLSTIEKYSLPGVDYISVGSLTHSAGSVDIHMKTEI